MAVAALAGVGAGCESHIQPLRPVQRIETWVTDEPVAAADATQPSTQPATAPETVAAAPTAGPATAPATAPAGRMVLKVVDPNQASRFIYNAGYDNVWQQAIGVLTKAGFTLDRQDYRLGVLSTKPLPGAQFVEFWKPQHVNALNAMENTINTQRRIVRITISRAEKPDFYEIGVQVLVERQTNPTEEIGGPIFVEGSGFGRNAVTLRSDYAPLKPEVGRWVTMGHDPDMEKKLIDALFERI